MKRKEIRLRTMFSFVDDGKKTVYPPSQTVPDQSMSIPEMIKRFSRGEMLTNSKSVYFDEIDEIDESFVDPTDIDLSDIDEQSRRLDVAIEDEKLAKDELKRLSEAKKPKGKGKYDAENVRSEVEDENGKDEPDDLE